MKLITWNVNSVRVRLDHLLKVLETESPDVICLQEIKCDADKFPMLEVQAAGYYSAVLGQPGYNGVAILSKEKPEQIRDGLDDQVSDTPQARAISANIGGIDVLNLYIPNGKVITSDKWPYKLRWLDALAETLEARYFDDDPLIICGDFNIAPKDEDVWDPEMWANSVLCHPDARSRYETLVEWGLTDVVRPHIEPPQYTWWDYRYPGLEEGKGLRIDHIMGTVAITPRVQNAYVMEDVRAWEQPSDHAPVVIELD